MELNVLQKSHVGKEVVRQCCALVEKLSMGVICAGTRYRCGSADQFSDWAGAMLRKWIPIDLPLGDTNVSHHGRYLPERSRHESRVEDDKAVLHIDQTIRTCSGIAITAANGQSMVDRNLPKICTS